MIVKTLVENTSLAEPLGAEHGLSLYIETLKHRILFDLGQGSLFLENALKMKVDIAEVDLVVISHGHFDHGGGLEAFLRANSRARIYLHKKAFDDHYAKLPDGSIIPIGLNKELMNNPRFIFVDDYLRIDEELELFSAVKGRELYSTANRSLLMQVREQIQEDTFEHEQNLIINECGKVLLLAGCAHNGIVNILNRMLEIRPAPADCVIGGFHLHNPPTNQSEDEELIKAIGQFLIQTGSQFYTGHCTGLEPYKILKDIMHEKIKYLATGGVVEL
jgi:7,8-dihydropterin-6-yl-methyl-4-(beta-D-ribofuranosyl)aminobenzene 5'-phosphate synthase